MDPDILRHPQGFHRVRMDTPQRSRAILGLAFALLMVLAGLFGLVLWMLDLSAGGDERAIVGFVIALAGIGLVLALMELTKFLWLEFHRLTKR